MQVWIKFDWWLKHINGMQNIFQLTKEFTNQTNRKTASEMIDIFIQWTFCTIHSKQKNNHFGHGSAQPKISRYRSKSIWFWFWFWFWLWLW
jgi:hypothetical protein